MPNKTNIFSIIKDIKNGKPEMVVDFFDDNGKKTGKLIPVVDSRLRDNREIVKFITELREYYKDRFLTQFDVTEERTKKWLDDQTREHDDRILFMVETNDDKLIGHMGVVFSKNEDLVCELDNFAKDKDCKIPGVMTFAERALINWLFGYLGIKKIKLRVFADNLKTQALHSRCGFSKTSEIKLKKEITKAGINYVEIGGTKDGPSDNILFVFELINNQIKK